jgi:TPR repeat protein
MHGSYMMGIILAGGKCGSKDESKAVEHWSAAAAQGDVWSQYRLATMSHVTKPVVDLTVAGEALQPGALSPSAVSPRRAAAADLLRAQVLLTTSNNTTSTTTTTTTTTTATTVPPDAPCNCHT